MAQCWLISAPQFLRKQIRVSAGYVGFRCGVILNEVKDLTLGVGLLKLKRVTYDRGRGPSLRAG
jgi:hypothetical protein